MDSIILIGLVAGALTTSSSIPQAVKIIWTKSAKDVSATFFILMSVVCSCGWPMAYSLGHRHCPLECREPDVLPLILGLKHVYSYAFHSGIDRIVLK